MSVMELLLESMFDGDQRSELRHLITVESMIRIYEMMEEAA